LRSAELTVDKPALLERFKEGYEVVRENGGFLGELGDDLARIALLKLADFSFPPQSLGPGGLPDDQRDQ